MDMGGDGLSAVFALMYIPTLSLNLTSIFDWSHGCKCDVLNFNVTSITSNTAMFSIEVRILRKGDNRMFVRGLGNSFWKRTPNNIAWINKQGAVVVDISDHANKGYVLAPIALIKSQ